MKKHRAQGHLMKAKFGNYVARHANDPSVKSLTKFLHCKEDEEITVAQIRLFACGRCSMKGFEVRGSRHWNGNFPCEHNINTHVPDKGLVALEVYDEVSPVGVAWFFDAALVAFEQYRVGERLLWLSEGQDATYALDNKQDEYIDACYRNGSFYETLVSVLLIIYNKTFNFWGSGS